MGMQASQDLLSQMAVDAELLDSGCCGMAGSFGYERDHYDVSLKVAEHALLPRVRSTPAETLIVSNGFSCREQIAQSTNRRALHLSEVLQMGLHEGPAGPATGLPETDYVQKPAPFPWKTVVATAATVVLAAVLLIRRR
jgi:hypothetical protein